MKTIINLKSLVLSLAIIVFAHIEVTAQEFPTIWAQSQYDYSKGNKGRLDVINYTPTSDNKAYIFATNVVGQSGAQDLFRLTCQGTASFNSPISGYDVNVNFYTDKNLQGGISGSGGVLRIFGQNRLSIGTHSQNDLILISPDKVSCSPNIYVDYNGVQMRFGLSDDQQCGWVGSQFENHVVLGTNKKAAIIIDKTTQNVYIGLPYPKVGSVSSALKSKYALFVQKGILAEDYSIAPVASWSDRVFESDYRLRSLSEVENFIEENSHLPEVPSAQEIAENGYSQHEMNRILLQKIEELTLYTIQQQKEIAELRAKLGDD